MHYKRLTQEQRYTIERLNSKNVSQKIIAALIEVHPSTVSRELKRATSRKSLYNSTLAQKRAEGLKSRPSRRIDPELLKIVGIKMTQEQWSPEQISGYLKKHKLGSISHEAIYQHIYRDKAKGGLLHLHLRHRCKSYRKRSLGRERRGTLKNQVMIDQRPAIVDQRSRIGDWEMDTVIGHIGGAVLVTMVERFSRYTRIGLAKNKESVAVSSSIVENLKPLSNKVKTLTFDNGKEFAMHEILSDVLSAQSYFAHPYHSWERGLNENTNGLIRQYFPKGTDLSKVRLSRIKEVESLLNSRPRKCLGYATPHDIFYSTTPIALAA